MPTTAHDQTDELNEQMKVVHWGRFEKILGLSIFCLVVANLVVGILALGPDLWGS